MKPRITIAAVIGLLIIIFGTIYTVVQQAQRNAANYPQIQLAEDQASQIIRNDNPYVASTMTPVDMKSSLAPFVIVYDRNGKVVSGSGYLGDKVPTVATGILTGAKGQPYSAVTWQPQDGMRIAAVTVAAKGYYVLSGRSLTEVEKNESETFKLAFVGGVLALLVVIAALVGRKVSGGDPARPGGVLPGSMSGTKLAAEPASSPVLRPRPTDGGTDEPGGSGSTAPPVEPPLPPSSPATGF